MHSSESAEQLERKLQELEEVIEALRREEVDVVVGTSNVLLLRLKEAEDELRKHRDFLGELVERRTAELEEANRKLQDELARRERAESERLKEHEDRLRLYERLAHVGHLSGNVAHELRNPLATIDSSARYLEMTLDHSSGKAIKHLEHIMEAVGDCQAVISRLLASARVEEPYCQQLDLREVISQAVCASGVPSTIEVQQDCPRDEVPVSADRLQLLMAFRNIVQNAVQAMEGSGRLLVSLQEQGHEVVVSFVDSGPGVPDTDLDRIFEPLFTTKADGVGFGLSLVRMIIGKHGGVVEAERGRREGANVIVRLPREAVDWTCRQKDGGSKGERQ